MRGRSLATDRPGRRRTWVLVALGLAATVALVRVQLDPGSEGPSSAQAGTARPARADATRPATTEDGAAPSELALPGTDSTVDPPDRSEVARVAHATDPAETVEGGTRVVAPGLLSGTVLGPDREPLNLFRIRLREHREERGAGRVLRSQRGRGGRFELEVAEAGTYVLEARYGTHLPARVRLEVRAPESGERDPDVVELWLREPARIQGHVVGPDGTAVANAVVHAFQPGTGEAARARTTEDGHFRLERLPLEPWVLFAKHEDFADSGPRDVHVQANRATTGVALALRETALVSGTVRFEDATPAEGCTVWLWWAETPDAARLAGSKHAHDGRTASTTVAADGTFRFALRTGGTYRLTASHTAHAGEVRRDRPSSEQLVRTTQAPGTVAFGGTQSHDLVLVGGPGRVVTGIVSLNGETLARQRLELADATEDARWTNDVRTDREGRFTALVPEVERVRVTFERLPSLAEQERAERPASPGPPRPGGTVVTERARVWNVAFEAKAETSFTLPISGPNLRIELEAGWIEGSVAIDPDAPVPRRVEYESVAEGAWAPRTRGSVGLRPDGSFSTGPIPEGSVRLRASNETDQAGPWTHVHVVARRALEGVGLEPLPRAVTHPAVLPGPNPDSGD